VRARDLLADLRRRGVTFEADGDRISVDAPAGVIDEQLRKALLENKSAIIKLLEWERRRLREADRRGLLIEWSRERDWIALHDPTTGEWHEAKASACLPWVVDAANARRCKVGGATH
jgi:predicted metal-dependent hydrolase